MSRLSSILSEAIVQALEDLDKCMQSPDYQVDFGDWHIPTKAFYGQFNTGNRTICLVCFAGSVMAQRLGAKIDEKLTPKEFDEETMLYALDFIRSGKIYSALIKLGIERPKNLPDFVPVNQKIYEHFVTDMEYIVELLKEQGL